MLSPQTAATTFAFSSVFILLLWLGTRYLMIAEYGEDSADTVICTLWLQSMVRTVLTLWAVPVPYNCRVWWGRCWHWALYLMIAEYGEDSADTLVHSLQADGAEGQLCSRLAHRVVLALLHQYQCCTSKLQYNNLVACKRIFLNFFSFKNLKNLKVPVR